MKPPEAIGGEAEGEQGDHRCCQQRHDHAPPRTETHRPFDQAIGEPGQHHAGAPPMPATSEPRGVPGIMSRANDNSGQCHR